MLNKLRNFYNNIRYKKVEYKIIDIEEKKIERQSVYNIEVEDNHNYFANDMLVSNCHLLKSSKTERSKNFNEIIKNTEKVWLLTGTPMTNRPIDYYNLLKIIKHPLSKNWVNYIEKYCDGKKIFGHWESKGASNLEELYNKTKDSVLRRLKKDVLKDLPNKDRTPVFLHLENKREYENVIKNYKTIKTEELKEEFSDFFEEDDFEVSEMTKFILWRQYCALKKIEDGSLIDLINSQIDSDNKIVVFTNFTKVVDTVYEKLGNEKCRFIDGRISDSKKRLDIVKEFNENKDLKVLVCNLKVGSVGLNIQSANVAIINDMDWVPSTMLQAEDRLWRIGQLFNVSILYLIYKGTVEEIVFNVVNKKMKNISEAIEGKVESYFFSDKNDEENIEKTKKTKKSILFEIFSQLK